MLDTDWIDAIAADFYATPVVIDDDDEYVDRHAVRREQAHDSAQFTNRLSRGRSYDWLASAITKRGRQASGSTGNQRAFVTR